MNNDTALDRVKRSLVNLEGTDPFFSSVALNLLLREDKSVPTACTDGRHLIVNPDYVMSKSRTYLDNVIVHEIVHVILKHPILLKKFPDKERARIAMELSVNSLIYMRSGFPQDVLIPGQGKYVDMPIGKNTEWYYDKLKEHDDNRNKQDTEDSSKDDNESEAESEDDGGSSNGDSNGAKEKADGKDSKEAKGTKESKDVDEETTQGSSSGEPGRDKDIQDSTIRGCEDSKEVSKELGEVEEYQFEENETENEVDRRWEQIISQAANDAASAGNMPGEFEELVTRMLGVTPLPWPVLLRQFLIRNVRRGRSFKRPNRRTLYRQDIAPSRMTKGLGKLVLGVDVSGSMDQEEMNKALATCIDIGKVYPDFELGIIQFDTDITKQDWFTRFNANKDYFKNWSWKGRGGTSYVAFFKQIKSFNADIVVLVTDGYPNDGWPDMRLIRTPVMWLITKEADIPENVKKHSRVIPLNNA